MATCIATRKTTGSWHCSRRRRRGTRRKGGSRFRNKRASGRRRGGFGRIPWWRMASSTCAIRSCCSATTWGRRRIEHGRGRTLLSGPLASRYGAGERRMAVPPGGFLDRSALAQLQRERLRLLLKEILPANCFYAEKLAGIQPDDIRSPADLARLPFTTKQELQADQERYPPYRPVLTYPLARYSRLHQTSRPSGPPLHWL